MPGYFENLKKNGKMSIAIVISILGAFLYFVSVCMKQSSVANLPSGSLNPFGLDWYFMFFYFFVTIALLVISATDSFTRYRFASMALVAIAISYIPTYIHANLLVSQLTTGTNNSTISNLGSAGGLAAAGLIMIILPFFAILGWLGSETDAPVNNLKDSLPIQLNVVSVGGRKLFAPKAPKENANIAANTVA